MNMMGSAIITPTSCWMNSSLKWKQRKPLTEVRFVSRTKATITLLGVRAVGPLLHSPQLGSGRTHLVACSARSELTWIYAAVCVIKQWNAHSFLPDTKCNTPGAMVVILANRPLPFSPTLCAGYGKIGPGT